MTERESLLHNILREPADDTARLVFADWLEENGEEERAEFVRCQVARLSGVVSKRHRERSLLLSNVIKWLKEMPPLNEIMLNEKYPHSPSPTGIAGRFNRGFISHIELPCPAFLTHAKALFALHPITSVRLTDKEPEDLGYGWSWFNEPNIASPSSIGDEFWLENDGKEGCTRWVRANSEDCIKALSIRAVCYGRALAGLPAEFETPVPV